jgi:hypothetical protein
MGGKMKQVKITQADNGYIVEIDFEEHKESATSVYTSIKAVSVALDDYFHEETNEIYGGEE